MCGTYTQKKNRQQTFGGREQRKPFDNLEQHTILPADLKYKRPYSKQQNSQTLPGGKMPKTSDLDVFDTFRPLRSLRNAIGSLFNSWMGSVQECALMMHGKSCRFPFLIDTDNGNNHQR